MRLTTQNYSIYIGKGIAKMLEKEISLAGERVWVISPWISPRLLELLADRSDEVDVRVGTRDPVKLKAKRYAPVLPVLLAAIIAFFVYRPAAVALVVLAALIVLTKKRAKLIIEDLGHDVHAKIYLIDDTAYLGSANLTESGLLYNYETLVVFDERKAVRAIEKELKRFL